MLAGLINKENLVVHIIQALIWATGWQVLLWMSEYPINERVGVVVIGYFAWYVSHTIFDNTMRFALVRAYRYAVRVHGEPEKHAKVSKRTEWIAGSLAGLFNFGAVLITSGFMFILTWLGLIAFGFPSLGTNIQLVGLVSVASGLCMILPFLSLIIYVFALGKNRLSIRERVVRVSAVAWAEITRERFILKWAFGLNW